MFWVGLLCGILVGLLAGVTLACACIIAKERRHGP